MINIYIPAGILIVSLFILILTVFLLFYYQNGNIWVTIIFGIGILLGLIACSIFIYLRTPMINDVIIYEDRVYDGGV